MNECPVCNEQGRLFYQGAIRHGQKGATEGHIFRCPRCQLQWLRGDQRLSPESYRDGSYHSRIRDNAEAVKLASRRAANLLPANLPDGSVVCDVGAGHGELLDAYEMIVFCDDPHLWAVDPSYRGFRFDGLKTAMESTAMINDDSVDLLICFQVIEHVQDPVQFAKELHRILKPGGMMVLTTPNASQWLMRHCSAFQRHFYRTHHNWYFNGPSITSLLQATGFRIHYWTTATERGLDNVLGWLVHGRPNSEMPAISRDTLDAWESDMLKNSTGGLLVVRATK